MRLRSSSCLHHKDIEPCYRQECCQAHLNRCGTPWQHTKPAYVSFCAGLLRPVDFTRHEDKRPFSAAPNINHNMQRAHPECGSEPPHGSMQTAPTLELARPLLAESSVVLSAAANSTVSQLRPKAPRSKSAQPARRTDPSSVRDGGPDVPLPLCELSHQPSRDSGEGGCIHAGGSPESQVRAALTAFLDVHGVSANASASTASIRKVHG